ncbi:MAG: GNAT family N-acetyltransferase [Alloprevotella sp.]|nr:N-acetyltransferase [Bacteroidales bacterium]MDY3943071.1 GNAT family N-acetyltransferase [Alloprevotella sp.]
MIHIRFEAEAQRFAAYDGDTLAGVCSYREENGAWVADHTEVHPDFRGQQVAQRLVEALFAKAEEEGIEIIPQCSYVAKLMARRAGTEN